MRIVVLDAFDEVMRGFQPGIRNYHDVDTAALFEAVNFFALLVEQVCCAFDWNFRQYLAGIILERFLFEQTQDCQR